VTESVVAVVALVRVATLQVTVAMVCNPPSQGLQHTELVVVLERKVTAAHTQVASVVELVRLVLERQTQAVVVAVEPFLVTAVMVAQVDQVLLSFATQPQWTSQLEQDLPLPLAFWVLERLQYLLQAVDKYHLHRRNNGTLRIFR
jgi:carbon starvation protein CstA